MASKTAHHPPIEHRLGYARVSTVGQSLEVQLDRLKEAGCDLIFKDKASGTRDDRRELNRLLTKVGPGTEVVVTKIDRLSRSMTDLFSVIKRIDAAGGRFRSLDPGQSEANTSTSTGRLFLGIMCWMADTEREMILTRTAEGKARRRAQGGFREGRPRKLSLDQQREALRRLEVREPLSSIARSFNVSPPTIARLRAKPEVRR